MPEPLFRNAAHAGQKRICCCGAGVWTKVVAWVEIIGYGIAVLFVGLVLAVMIMICASHINNLDVPEGFTTLADVFDEPFVSFMVFVSQKFGINVAEDLNTSENEYYDPFNSWTWIFVRIGLYFFICADGFVSAVTLLVGAKKVRPNLLWHWLFHTYAILPIEFLFGYLMFCSASDGELPIYGIGLLILVLHQSFFIMVVRTHKKEMENKYQRWQEESLFATTVL